MFLAIQSFVSPKSDLSYLQSIDYVVYLYTTGYEQYKQGQYRAAEAFYTKAQETIFSCQSPQDIFLHRALIYLYQGYLKESQEKLQEAMDFYQKALTLVQQSAQANSPNLAIKPFMQFVNIHLQLSQDPKMPAAEAVSRPYVEARRAFFALLISPQGDMESILPPLEYFQALKLLRDKPKDVASTIKQSGLKFLNSIARNVSDKSPSFLNQAKAEVALLLKVIASQPAFIPAYKALLLNDCLLDGMAKATLEEFIKRSIQTLNHISLSGLLDSNLDNVVGFIKQCPAQHSDFLIELTGTFRSGTLNNAFLIANQLRWMQVNGKGVQLTSLPSLHPSICSQKSTLSIYHILLKQGAVCPSYRSLLITPELLRDSNENKCLHSVLKDLNPVNMREKISLVLRSLFPNNPEIQWVLFFAQLAILDLHHSGISRKPLMIEIQNYKPEKVLSDFFLRGGIVYAHFSPGGYLEGGKVVAYKSPLTTTEEICASLLHELTHALAYEVFENGGNPYFQNHDEDNQKIFQQIVKRLQAWPHHVCDQIKQVFDSYEPKEWDLELIVRVPQILAENESGRAKLEQHYPDLLCYYQSIFMPLCERHIDYLRARHGLGAITFGTPSISTPSVSAVSASPAAQSAMPASARINPALPGECCSKCGKIVNAASSSAAAPVCATCRAKS
jgi:hypothetical protein